MKQSGFLTRQELLNAGMRRERNGDECMSRRLKK